MWLLKKIIELQEDFWELKYAPDERVIWTTNPNMRPYIESSQLDNEDVAYIVAKTVWYFKRALWIKLSIIERFHVKRITQDTVQRFKDVFREFPDGTTHFSPMEFRDRVWSYLAEGSIILPDKMYVEVAQRMIFEAYSVPIELIRGCEMTFEIPRSELDYLSILQYRQKTPFTWEEYNK